MSREGVRALSSMQSGKGNEMNLSVIATWTAEKMPSVATLGLRFWGEYLLRFGYDEHWLFKKLRTDLGIRFRKRAQLLTGQSIYVDPFDSVGKEIYADGCYEQETVALFQSILT